jgi:hypothetical protein
MNPDPDIFDENTEDFDPARYLDAHGEMAPDVSELKKDGHSSWIREQNLRRSPHGRQFAFYQHSDPAMAMNFKHKKLTLKMHQDAWLPCM